MTSTLDAAAIQNKSRNRNAHILAALTSTLDADSEPARSAAIDVLGETLPSALSAALSALAVHWRDEATAISNAGRRGAKGVSSQYTQAAALLSGVAVSLRQHDTGDVETVEPTTVDNANEPIADEMPNFSEMAIEIAFGDVTNNHGSAPGAEPVTTVEEPTPAPTLLESEMMPTPVGVPPLAQRPEAIAAPADPFADPAPVGRAAYAGRVFTFDDLLNSAPALPMPEHLSHSQMETLSDCGLKYRLQRLEGIGERPSWSLIGGTAVHAAIAQLELQLADAAGSAEVTSAMLPGTADTRTLWRGALTAEIMKTLADNPGTRMEDWHAAKQGKEGFTWWQVEGEAMLTRYISQRVEWGQRWAILRDADGKPMIERGYEVSIASHLPPLKGAVDQVWYSRTDHGHILLRDMKSGSHKPDETFQLGGYAHALARLGVGYRLAQGAYWMARTGEHVGEVPDLIARHTLGELTYRMTAAMVTKQSGLFAPRVSSFCVSCSVAGACPARQG